MLIIIITYNSEKTIGKCLFSLIKTCEIIPKNILIIDNSPNNKTVDLIRDKFSEVNVIKNSQNLGFAKSVNQGLTWKVDSEYCLINPDITIKGNIFKLLQKQKNFADFGVIGVQTYNTGMRWHPTTYKAPKFLTGIFEFTNIKKMLPSNYWTKQFNYIVPESHVDLNLVSVDAVSGEFMYIKKSTIQKIGLFDTDYFMYMEDIDYCMRARNSGIKIGHLLNSIVTHIGGASTGNKYKIKYQYWSNSRRVYFRKHCPVGYWIILGLLFSIDDFFVWIVKLVKHEHKNY